MNKSYEKWIVSNKLIRIILNIITLSFILPIIPLIALVGFNIFVVIFILIIITSISFVNLNTEMFIKDNNLIIRERIIFATIKENIVCISDIKRISYEKLQSTIKEVYFYVIYLKNNKTIKLSQEQYNLHPNLIKQLLQINENIKLDI